MKLPVIAAMLIAALALTASAEAAAKKSKKASARANTSTVQARPGSASDPYAVYVSGEYVGRDPDPNIRAYMRKNPHDWDGPE